MTKFCGDKTLIRNAKGEPDCAAAEKPAEKPAEKKPCRNRDMFRAIAYLVQGIDGRLIGGPALDWRPYRLAAVHCTER
jgi:hypothetical protein